MRLLLAEDNRELAHWLEKRWYKTDLPWIASTMDGRPIIFAGRKLCRRDP